MGWAVRGSSPGRAKQFSLVLGPTQSAIQWVPGFFRGCKAAGACSWPLIFIQVRASEWVELYGCRPMCLHGMMKNQLTLSFMVNPRGDFDKGVHEHRVIIIFRRVRTIAKSKYYIRHVPPHGTTRLPIGGFAWNLIIEYFLKICRESSSFIKIGQDWRLIYMKTNIRFL